MAACAKTPAAAHPGEAAAATPSAAASKPGAADEAPPPEVDISKLDDFGKKVYRRIGNAEPSVCGQAQSLFQSAKSGACRRSSATTI